MSALPPLRADVGLVLSNRPAAAPDALGTLVTVLVLHYTPPCRTRRAGLQAQAGRVVPVPCGRGGCPPLLQSAACRRQCGSRLPPPAAAPRRRSACAPYLKAVAGEGSRQEEATQGRRRRVDDTEGGFVHQLPGSGPAGRRPATRGFGWPAGWSPCACLRADEATFVVGRCRGGFGWPLGLAGARGRSGRGAPKSGVPAWGAGRCKISWALKLPKLHVPC